MHNSTYTIILLSETFQANCLCSKTHVSNQTTAIKPSVMQPDPPSWSRISTIHQLTSF